MPKTPLDYSNCCIYKIEHFENDKLVYVGHTTNFIKRKGAHKSICNNETGIKFNIKLYKMIRDNGGWDCFKMIEVEKYPCKDRREAERREDEVMKELKASMNAIKSFITDEEKKEQIIEYTKEYRETNKEKIKQYRDDHKDIKREYNKEYRRTNNNEINTKITCKCGCEVSKYKLKRHERNKKHVDLMKRIV